MPALVPATPCAVARPSCAAIALLCASAGAGLLAQEAPDQAFRRYDRRDGLPHEQVRCLQADERGYLWVGTGGRLCRGDGTMFACCDDEAMVAMRVDCLASGPGGRLLLGMTGPRLARYDPARRPCLRELRLPGGLGRNVCALLPDAGDLLFFATEAGLFLLEAAPAAEPRCVPVRRDARSAWYGALARDARGRLLYARSDLALRRDGEREETVSLALGPGNVWKVEPLDGDRCLLLGDRSLVEVDFARPGSRCLPLPALGEHRLTAMCTDRRGDRWLGTTDGVLVLPAGGGAPRRHLAGTWVLALCCDRNGDVWVGTQNGLLRHGSLPFAVLRGAGEHGAVQPLRLLRAGDEVLVATADGLWRPEQDRLAPTPAASRPELRTGSAVVADRCGDLWFADDAGLLRLRAHDCARAATAPLERLPCAPKGLGLDHAGNVLCNVGSALLRLAAGGRDGRTELAVPEALRTTGTPHGDAAGRCYLPSERGLVQVTAAGAAVLRSHGAPAQVRTMLVDGRGRLWLVVRDHLGLAEVVAQQGDELSLRWIEPGAGLPGGQIEGLCADRDGRLWLAVAEHLCRYDPDTGDVRSWTWPEEAALGTLQDLEVDGHGRVFVAASAGVVAFTPGAQRSAPPPRVLVTSLLCAGAAVPLPDGGTTVLAPVELPADRGDLVIGCCAPGGPRGAAHVQYRLLPAETQYSPPLAEPRLQFARLAPGAYQLELRAAAADGLPAGATTVLRLSVPPPLWRRAEFVLGAAFVLVASGVALHRGRVRRLLAMEAVRRQIATDLHDDLGAGLAQVAVLSEVGKRRPGGAELLDEIGGLARGMRESLGDIVWAVDPTRDTLADLVGRLRQVANNLFADGQPRLVFTAPPVDELAGAALPPDRRRHLFLLGKEALANVARHADARTVEMAFALRGRTLHMTVADDGRGFDPASAAGQGHGRASMQARAAAIGAALAVRSGPQQGTRIEVELPLA